MLSSSKQSKQQEVEPKEAGRQAAGSGGVVSESFDASERAQEAVT